MSAIYIIGLGGIGSWLAASLRLLEDPNRIWCVDKDRIEEKNLNRQLFSPRDVGRSKAEAVADLYGCNFINAWFGYGSIKTRIDDWLIVCADNHPTRLDAINECDRVGCRVIVAANETSSAEAFFYMRNWEGNAKLDPRKYYPELANGHENDPRAAAIGCTGEAQRQNTQLVSANFMAAALAQHMFIAWSRMLPKCRDQRTVMPFMPHRLNANASMIETHTVG